MDIIQRKKDEIDPEIQKVVDNYSHSPWVDDAVIHQIFLAKKTLSKRVGSFGIHLVRSGICQSIVRKQHDNIVYCSDPL